MIEFPKIPDAEKMHELTVDKINAALQPDVDLVLAAINKAKSACDFQCKVKVSQLKNVAGIKAMLVKLKYTVMERKEVCTSILDLAAPSSLFRSIPHKLGASSNLVLSSNCLILFPKSEF